MVEPGKDRKRYWLGRREVSLTLGLGLWLGNAGCTARPSLPASSMLPNLGASYAAVRGTQTLVSGYAGPLFRLRNAANTVFLDVPAGAGTNCPLDAIIRAFIRANGKSYFAAVYDQTGNGFDLTLPTSNMGIRPVDLTQKTPSGALWIDTTDASSAEWASSGHAIDLQDHSLFIAQQSPSGTSGMLVSYDDGMSTQESWSVTECWLRISDGGARTFGNNNAEAYVRSNPAVVGITNTGSFYRAHIAEMALKTSTSPPAAKATRICYGRSKSAQPQCNRWCGDALLTAALSQPDGAMLYETMSRLFGFTTVYDRRLIIIGDSIESDPGPTDRVTNHRPPWTYAKFAGSTEVLNVAVAGRQIIQQAGPMTAGGNYVGYANNGARKYGAGKVITYFQTGTNDIANGRLTGSQTANSAGAAIGNFRKYAPDSKVIWCTLSPCRYAASNRILQAYRAEYNAAVAANPGSLAHAIMRWDDVGSTMGSLKAPDDASLYYDRLHPTDQGKRYRAGADPMPRPISTGPANMAAAVNMLWS